MTPSNQIPAVCNYGTSAVYSDYPSPEQMRAGVVPLDSLPAAWWNKMWCASNCAINEARDMVGQIITEVNNVLCQAGINPQAACTDQLYQSINKIRQTLATASVAGAVVSSSTASEVAVDPTTGRMTVNCLGNAASLSTSASTIVGAINELKSTYDSCFSDTATALNGKAPTSHASSATTYGVGSADNYGHLKISDTYTSVLAACSGVAASQKALACVYAVAAAAVAGNVALGNTAGCALGTAAAGTAITAARSDHVHPMPTLVTCADEGKNGSSYSAFGSNAFNSTAFTTCTGTVTKVKVGSTEYSPSSGVVSLPAYPSAPAIVCCAKCNGSGTAFGTAAVCSTRAGGSVTFVPYAGTDGCPLLTSNFLAYWNGAYNNSGNSNLKYYCGGAFGTAAACAATAFLGASGCAYDSARLGGTAASCYDKWTIGTFGCAEWGRNSVGNFYVRMKALTACCNVYKAFMCALGCTSTSISISRGMPVLGHIDTHNISILQMATGNYFDIYRNDGAVSCRFSLGSTANPGTSDMEFFGYFR